jgi:hypothetical protein
LFKLKDFLPVVFTVKLAFITVRFTLKNVGQERITYFKNERDLFAVKV